MTDEEMKRFEENHEKLKIAKIIAIYLVFTIDKLIQK